VARTPKLTPDEQLLFEVTGRLPDRAGEFVRAVRRRSDEELERRYSLQAGESTDDPNFTLEILFPNTHLRLTRGDPAAAIIWPRAGNERGLAVLLAEYLAAGDDNPSELLFVLLNDALVKAGREPWTPRAFATALAERYDAEEAREAEQEEKIVSRTAGRRKSQKTFIVAKIRATIHCSGRRAYAILDEGTAVADQRIALARAFANDPERCLPRDWGPRFKTATWGRSSARTFDRYVLDRVDAFEGGTIGDALAILIPKTEEGWLSVGDRPESLLTAIRQQELAITADAALDLWARYLRWKRDAAEFSPSLV
jgi:hypothetical protein